MAVRFDLSSKYTPSVITLAVVVAVVADNLGSSTVVAVVADNLGSSIVVAVVAGNFGFDIVEVADRLVGHASSPPPDVSWRRASPSHACNLCTWR